MRCIKHLLVMAICSCLAIPLLCHSQATEVDQISGTIVDSTGASIANAVVKATQTSTGFTRTAVTGPGGAYTLRSLPIGPYRLEVSAPASRLLFRLGSCCR